jgi:ABC-type branched-subunit amino acid transport system ATPase component/ABC-type branched-subunit amino acid transport system permease subunit
MPSFFSDLISSGVLAIPLIGVYVLFTVGIVVIYRASRVLNLAHGALALVPAYLFYSLGKHGVPLWIAATAGVLGGALLGMATERLVVRRLRRQGPVAQTVGTIAVYGFVVAVVLKIYGGAPLLPPHLLPSGIGDRFAIGDGYLRYAAVWLFVIGTAATLLCLALFRFTSFGLAMRAAADNRRAAALMGVDPDRTTAAAWGLGGALAGLAGVLVGTYGTIDAQTLGLQVLPAFVAALLGGLESLSGALVGCAVVALVEAEIPTIAQIPGLGALGHATGASQLILVVLAVIVLATRGQRLAASQVRGAGGFLASVRRPRRRQRTGTRPSRGVVAAAVAGVLVVLPFLPFVPFSFLGDFILAGYYCLAALSVVLLTGWVGQISLAQAELVGVGAFLTALVTNRLGAAFPVSFVLAALVAGAVAGILGAVALRVRGLYLAITTLVFAWMCDAFLFNQSWLGVAGGSAEAEVPKLGDPKALPYFDFTSRTLLYVIVLAVVVGVIYVLANLSDSKTGRAFFALRGSEVAAASLGINVTRYKLLAFVASGVIAGMAGNLVMVYQRSVEPSQFDILTSLFFLGVAVVGGIESMGGAVLAAIVFAALSEVFFRVQALAGFLGIVSSSLLLGVLLLYPGGLAAAVEALAAVWDTAMGRLEPVRRRASQAAVRRSLDAAATAMATLQPRRTAPDTASASGGGSEHSPLRVASPATHTPRARFALLRRASATVTTDTLQSLIPAAAEAAPPRAEAAALAVLDGSGDGAVREPQRDRTMRRAVRRPERRVTRMSTARMLLADDITVRFGGLLAVNGASLEVRRGEVVGLIGPNGAGKTTLFNVISGLQRATAGTVEILGTEASLLAVHERAQLGVGRTFQAIQLFPQLSVFENLLVATHMRNGSRLTGHCLALPGAVATEVEMRHRVIRVLDFLDLRGVAREAVADLPFGVLRMVELARALVTGPELLLLDEPASGLDTRESARFAELLLHCRDTLGLSMLVIEHDIATVMGVSDYLYVLDYGRIIAEGLPHLVREDPAVIEAYLGQPSVAEVG